MYEYIHAFILISLEDMLDGTVTEMLDSLGSQTRSKSTWKIVEVRHVYPTCFYKYGFRLHCFIFLPLQAVLTNRK